MGSKFAALVVACCSALRMTAKRPIRIHLQRRIVTRTRQEKSFPPKKSISVIVRNQPSIEFIINQYKAIAGASIFLATCVLSFFYLPFLVQQAPS